MRSDSCFSPFAALFGGLFLAAMAIMAIVIGSACATGPTTLADEPVSGHRQAATLNIGTWLTAAGPITDIGAVSNSGTRLGDNPSPVPSAGEWIPWNPNDAALMLPLVAPGPAPAPHITTSACDTQQDMDCDGVPDARDNCAWFFNEDQADTDNDGLGDGIGDVCDIVPGPNTVDKRAQLSRPVPPTTTTPPITWTAAR